MQEVTEESVIGDFNDVEFEHFGIKTTFHRDADRYLVTTPGPEGTPETYEIAYTFGADPLQQYLIEFPGGRYQALQICWDARPAGEGGQRWYHLYPDEPIPHTDVLHWTKQHFNWNYMCADCHSTNLSKNFDPETDSYHTTWSELTVSCESCHGAGQAHAEWARGVAGKPTPEGGYDSAEMALSKVLKEPVEGVWGLDSETGQPKRTHALTSDVQVESCAPCHSHRRLLEASWGHAHVGLHDTHVPSILEQALYHNDGQIREEVYVYGSFKQSKMAHAGVRCTDCHNHHTMELKAEGNNLCIQCHQGDQYNTPEHHRHLVDSAGASCVDCHMPGKYYMGVDWRRDHSFRVPRPDLAEKLGTPDACSGCHEQIDPEQNVAWTANAFREWYGDRLDSVSTHPGLELAEARSGMIENPDTILTRLVQGAKNGADRPWPVPPIVRASAVSDLGSRLSGATLPVLREALTDPAPEVRRAAIEALGTALSPEQKFALMQPRLDDPSKAVRVEAARQLASSRSSMTGSVARSFDKARKEYEESLDAVSDRASGHMGRALLLSDLGDQAGAEKAYRTAFRIEPTDIPSRINLSELLYQSGRGSDAGAILLEAAQLQPASAVVQESLGRHYIRMKDYETGLGHLGRASELAPNDPRLQFFYGVALNSLDRFDDALPVLQKAHSLAPTNVEYLSGLASICRDHGRWDLVETYAKKLLAISPSPQFQGLLREAQEKK